MSPGLCKLAHVALRTPDIERSVTFFRDILGMDEVARGSAGVHLRCFGELDHHSLWLIEGPTSVDHVAFRTAAPEDVDLFSDQIAGVGVDVSDAPSQLGHGRAIRFTAPFLEAPLELFWEIERPLAPADRRSRLPTNSTRFRGAAPRRIDHINLSTAPSDLGPGEAWVREQLGFKRRECVELDGRLTGSWLSVTSQVHDLAITLDHQGRRGRMNHVAFTMESFADIVRMADIVAEHDVKVDVAPGRHGVTQGCFYYVRDPGSGHRVELFAHGYLIFDPDWEPIVWHEESFNRYGLRFFGPEWTRAHNPNAENTPCFSDVDAVDGAGRWTR
jgi:catechol 2,3 dioxygenase